jgi:hypothetical protein
MAAAAECGGTHASTDNGGHRALTKKLGPVTLKRLDAFYARRLRGRQRNRIN